MRVGAKRGRSPLRGRYLVQNPALLGGLAAVDLLLALRFRRSREAERLGFVPRRVLFCIGGHLGDAVVASSVLPTVERVWPEAEVGLLVGSWSRPVYEGSPFVRWIHTVDHWKLNRTAAGVANRLRRYGATRRQALREIRGVGYDLAVDFHPFFPNSIPLLWHAGIPIRIGYTSAGFGALLTHAVRWRDSDRHMSEHHRVLLGLVDPRFLQDGGIRYSLPSTPSTDLPCSPGELGREDYLVLHMGAGSRLKEWPRENWRALVDRLLSDGHTLAFTGAGAAQREDAERTIGGRSGCHNLCDRLTWAQFVQTIARARLVISIDSAAGHVATAVGTPVVALMSGMNRVSQWQPLGDRVATVTHAVPCAPCHRSRGCAGMTCVRGIAVEDVLRAADRLLLPEMEGSGPPGRTAPQRTAG